MAIWSLVPQSLSMPVLSPEVLLAAFMTGVGFLGGFPQPPRIFTRIAFRYPIVQWLMVYILIWQGGGGKNAKLSGIVTFALYLLKTLIDAAF